MPLKFIKKLVKGHVGTAPQSAPITNVLQPDAPFFAIGDLHGRLDLMDSLLQKIDPSEDQTLVFLGDYIDRGPNAAGTLARLFALAHQRPNQVVCLMGNHEKMMLDFIDDPLGKGGGWLRNGGIATLESYGINGIADSASADDILEVCETFEGALPAGMLAWVRQLPLCWNSGNIWCVHAAMDPGTSPHAQRSKTMLWGHRDFMRADRKDDAVIIHGHTIVGKPTKHNSRIAIDTGAYQTQQLTAAHISAESCTFVST
ncbi:metallophosphoesterase family protein [Yoonia maricola]|uniref:metallophosphoesterase family protein n=1 Tax=Yoonia maricola TaxID=420999 RepID=UPI001454F6E1|nr:metallophosphoesterase family protein [Yoonia maricola]